ncbi:siderophore-interacting protein [Vibrio sp. Isolate24]|uniref:siderophore-interacting protein n=1 Tax=Vibrio sp. Isolate24 TaxID=2908534 RepID=UPI001EFCEC63|nr:siderophore-interacting protein [Vibrio sp. Isolate24]MCG9677518.1 siderophore-interacting protein [Vibrio sp. Isolate24]
MKKPSAKTLIVQSTESVTPNMQRITLQGSGLADFPNECEGGYIKLLFNQEGSTDLSQLTETERPVMRTYTIRQFDPKACAIEVDFVRHITQDLQCGFAARWAMGAKVGDTISIAGPGSISTMNLQADWFFMVADMTALPALSVKVRSLPEQAKGYAVIQVESEEDIQPVDAPKNVEVIWLNASQSLVDQVRKLTWLEGMASIWCACEFDSMRQLRQYFRNEKEVGRENIYISSYWKQGVSEDGHKVIKRQDADENQ